MTRHRGLTIVEILVCIAIIVTVVAIVVPVTSKARHSARVTSALLRLKHLHAAFKLYQADHGGDGMYGNCYEMNLPDIHTLTRYRLYQPKELWISPCDTQNRNWSYLYYPNHDPSYTGYFRTYQEASLLLADLTCDSNQGLRHGDYLTTRAIGVRLSGEIMNYNKPGDPTAWQWWHSGDIRVWR